MTQDSTLFTYGVLGGRKKRQTPSFECTSFDNCGDHSIVAMAFEDLNFSEEERAFCNNDSSCLYDLQVTGDEEVARLTQISSENSARMLASLSENNTILTVTVTMDCPVL